MFMTEPQPNRPFRWTQAPTTPWGAALVCDPLAEIAPHLFTVGNLQLRDDHAEWSAVAAAFGITTQRIRLIRQVHGVAVAAARNGVAPPPVAPEADVIVSDDASVAVAVRVADCAPVLIADSRLGNVCAVHAGWRGTMLGAVKQGVRALIEVLETRPSDLVAAIGPCLGPCCGEVGPEVVDAFRANGHDQASLEAWFSPGASGRPYLDLWKANRDQLVAAGVAAENVHIAGLCSKTHAGLMHSYRAEGQRAGRMLGIIRKRPVSRGKRVTL
jgi:hypothetical protein